MSHRLTFASSLALMGEKRILVVDDEGMVLEAVKMTLTHYGYTVETASGAVEALTKFETGPFDLVVSDLKMPGMTGDRLAKEIKQRSPQMPIVLLTGYPPEVYPSNVDAVLLKPFSTLELRSTIAKLLKTNSGEKGSPPAAS